MRHIETKEGLAALLERMDNKKKKESRERLPEFDEWRAVVVGCLADGLAMDYTDYENAPHWFRVLWVGLR